MANSKKLGASFMLALILWWGPAFAQQVIKMGSIPIASELPLHAAIGQGYFQGEGIKVDVQTVAGGAAAIPALVGGSLHVSTSAYLSVFPAQDRGFDITILMPYDRVGPGNDASPIVVRADANIKTARHLEGKTLAVNVLKSLNWLYAVEWVSKNGLSPDKVNWIEMPFPNMIAALRAKQIDGASATEPFVSLEMEKGGLHLLSRPFSDADPALPISGVVAKESWVKANGPLVERFSRALRKGIDYVNANRGKWPEVLATYTRLRPEWVPKLTFPIYEYPVSLERLQAAADLSLKWRLLDKRVAVKEMVWPTALEK